MRTGGVLAISKGHMNEMTWYLFPDITVLLRYPALVFGAVIRAVNRGNCNDCKLHTEPHRESPLQLSFALTHGLLTAWFHYLLSMDPEEEAREIIDEMLEAAGWVIQDYGDHNR